MKEGDVVTVTGRLDTRIKESEAVRGTIVSLTQDAVWVLLSDGNIWTGRPREVFVEVRDGG